MRNFLRSAISGFHFSLVRGGCWRCVAAALAIVGGCAPQRDDDAGSRIDSAGVTIVRLPTPSPALGAVWTSRLLFSTKDVDSLALGGTLDVVFLPDSTLLVGSGPDLVMLGANGGLSRRLGRAGDGPGEFRRIFRLGLAADSSVFVGDVWSGRFTQLRGEGGVVRILNRLDPTGSGREVDPVTVLSDGRILSTLWQWRPNRGTLRGMSFGAFERDPVPLLVHDRTGEVVDTIGLWPGLQRARVSLQGQEARLPVAFARSALYDGRGQFTVFGVSDSLDLSLYEATDLRLRLTGPGEHRRLSGNDRDMWRRALLRDQPDLGPMVLEALRGAPEVAERPALAALVLDEAGNTWVGEYVTPEQRERHWRIYSKAGELLGVVRLPVYSEVLVPSRTELLDVFGDRVAVLREADDGELVVEVRSIQRS